MTIHIVPRIDIERFVPGVGLAEDPSLADGLVAALPAGAFAASAREYEVFFAGTDAEDEAFEWAIVGYLEVAAAGRPSAPGLASDLIYRREVLASGTGILGTGTGSGSLLIGSSDLVADTLVLTFANMTTWLISQFARGPHVLSPADNTLAKIGLPDRGNNSHLYICAWPAASSGVATIQPWVASGS